MSKKCQVNKKLTCKMIGVSELDPTLSFPCRHTEGPVFPALQSRRVQQPVPHDRH